jgi:hypothetical protein
MSPFMNSIRTARPTHLAASFAALLAAICPLLAAGGAATSAELELRRNWVALHFGAEPAALPFSFIYGGRPPRRVSPSG